MAMDGDLSTILYVQYITLYVCRNKYNEENDQKSASLCRNPDGDKSPWCYTLSDSAISWEYCDIPSCQMPLSEFLFQNNEILISHAL